MIRATDAPWNAVPDGRDNYSAIQGAIDHTEQYFPGSVVSLPAGVFKTRSELVLKNASLICESRGAAALYSDQVDTTVLKVDGARNCHVSGITIWGKGVGQGTDKTLQAVTKPAMVIASGCVDCTFENLVVLGGRHCIESHAADNILRNVVARGAFGSSVFYQGRGGNFHRRNKFDQNWPVTPPTSLYLPPPWTPGQWKNLGDMVHREGWYLQCVAPGVTGPYPPSLKIYETDIQDGSAVWWLALPMEYYSVQLDTGAQENTFNDTDMAGAFFCGLGLTNKLGGAGPFSTKLTDCGVSQQMADGISCKAGKSISVSGLFGGGSSLAGTATIRFHSGFEGDAGLVNNHLIGGTTGVAIQSGENYVITGGNRIYTNRGIAIYVGANRDKIAITGNILGAASYGQNQYPVLIEPGSGSRILVRGNVIDGAAVGVVNQASGVGNDVGGNV